MFGPKARVKDGWRDGHVASWDAGAMRIETEEHATRLARAICDDILLYNQDAIASGQDMTAAIEEGRNVYRERVAERLLPIFEQALAAKGLGGPRGAIAARHAFEPAASPHPPLPARVPPRSSATPALLIGIAVLVAAAVGAWLVMAR